MYRARKNRRIVIGSLLILLLMISVGYAAFQTRLTIRGTSRITSNWDVRITNVTTGVATGDAENVSTPTWTDLTAYMEANLYDKGAAMDYDVTISNRGTFDAKLDNIITTPSSNEAVIITFSGYTKGEMLPKGQDKVIHVKIQYNPNYNGTAEVSGTSIVEFQYVQGEGSNIPTVTTHLLTYNYSENGGTSMNAENEYLPEGTVVNLQDKVAVKEGYTFVGWNTDKDAHTGINTTTMTANTTLYAIFKKDITVSYVKGTGISKINNQTSDYSTNYTLWNKDTSQNITLPSITLTDSTYSELLGWYDNDTKIGNPSDIYAAADTVTLTAKARNLPIMKKWTDSVPGNASYLNTTDFHDSEYRTKITSIEFVTTDTVPGNAIESWDVSEAGNGSVKAWITADPNDNTKYALHIGGEGGVIAPDDLGFAFKDFTVLKSINFTNLDTSNTENMYCMFESGSALTSIVFGNDFDTSKVKSFNYMFTNCSSLTSLDLSGFDTSSAEEMAGMFHACGGITGLNLSNFDTSNVTTMDRMFANCSGLTNLNLSNFDTSKVKSFSYMFTNCSSLTSLDLSSFDTSNVTAMEGMFQDLKNIKTLNLNNFNTSKVTNMKDMFNGPNSSDSKLELIYLCTINTNNVASRTSMFQDLPNLKAVYVGSGWTATNEDLFFQSNISSVTKLDNCKVTSGRPIMKRWPIEYNQNVETDFHATEYRTKITSIDVVTEINIPNGATNWDVSEASDGSVMAWVVDDGNNGYKLYIGGEGGVIANPTNSSWVFKEFTALTDANVANLDVSEVREMYGMFYGCTNLTSLDLATWDTNKATQMGGVFQNCTHLTTIYASDTFTVGQATNTGDMFSGDTVLVGGNGTTYSSSNTGGAYAKIDEPGQTGYFTNGIYPIITNVSTQPTSSAVTLIVDAYVPNGENITSYEYSINGGTTWVTQTNGNISPNMYTFTGLNSGTNYNIQIRVTSQGNKKTTKTVSVTTKQLESPTFSENSSGIVSIAYPTGCASPYICSYQIGDDEPVTVTTNSVTLPFGTDGTVRAIVSDGTSEEDSTYNLRKTDLYVSVNGNDTTGVGTVAQPYATLNKAYSQASSTTGSTIYVMNNINQSSSFIMNSNKDITITSSDSSGNTGGNIVNKVTRNHSNPYELISADTGSITLENIELDGNKATYPSLTVPVVMFGSAGTIKNGTIIENGAYGGVEVDEDASLTMQGGVIKNNARLSGAGIYANPDSTITIQGGTIRNNEATSTTDGGGGGIYAHGTLNISGGNIINNTSAFAGGGIVAQDTLTITGGAINNNTAVGRGGGIFSGNDSVLNINGATITGNKATTGDGYGAGLFLLADTEISNTTISNNTARTYGGGIFISAGTTTINSGTTISGNKATSNQGGGIRNNATLVMTDGIISSNSATSGGGVSAHSNGTTNISGGSIIKNTASSQGAGIYNAGTLNITGGTIGGSDANKNASTNSGGGVYNASTGTMELSGATISYNTGSSGGGIQNYGTLTIDSDGTVTRNKSTSTGGGIWSAGTLKVYTGAVITYNEATGGGGGGIWCTYTGSTAGKLTMTGGTVTNNKGTLGGGIGFSSNSISVTQSISGSQTVISNNQATTGNGGGIFLNNTGITLNFSNGVIASNKAPNGSGGAVRINSGATFNLRSGTIKKNTAKTDGGISKAGTYNNTSGYVCKNNSPTNTYDITATSNTNCS